MENDFGNRSETGSTPTAENATGTANSGSARQSLVDKAEQQARSRVNAAKKDAALTLSSVASRLLESSSHLRDEQQQMAGEYVGKAAEQIDRLAQYIQNTDPSEVVDNIEQFARRRPAVFIGAAFALGVIGARFLKSSRRHESDRDRLYSPGLTDREVPTLRADERGAATSSTDLTSRGVYGDGGFSASAGMPSTVPAPEPGDRNRGTGGTGGSELP